jgi:hypothetical protein
MDLFDKLNAGLEPLGGPLFVDSFVAARRAVHVRPQAAPSAGTPRVASSEAVRAAEERAPGPAAAPEPAAGAPPVLQDEVEAFLSRDQIEGTDDAEVQEFLKERSGYDPTSLD